MNYAEVRTKWLAKWNKKELEQLEEEMNRAILLDGWDHAEKIVDDYLFKLELPFVPWPWIIPLQFQEPHFISLDEMIKQRYGFYELWTEEKAQREKKGEQK